MITRMIRHYFEKENCSLEVYIVSLAAYNNGDDHNITSFIMLCIIKFQESVLSVYTVNSI